MSGLLYYLPGRKHVQLKDLPELGLAHAFEGDCTPCPVTGSGPDGSAGVSFADSSRVKRVGYYRDTQTWEKIPGNPAGAWIGRSNEPVTPEDLQRAEMLAGHNVRLADGRQWVVPVARGFAEEGDEPVWFNALPQKIGLDEQGNWTPGDVCDRYAAVWKIACEWWDSLFAASGEESEEGRVETREKKEKIEFDFPRLNDAACEVLAVNYRLSRSEVSFLGLFEDGTARDVLMAAIDWPSLKEINKKKLAGDSSGASGPPAA